MKYYNIVLLQTAAERMQQFLYNLGVRFEISAAGAYYHFEILLDPSTVEFEKVNDFIASDAITEA
jgi:5-hydroxyisourate hydrolase-like protein (transthyretin family)